jgi:hypothetical protein
VVEVVEVKVQILTQDYLAVQVVLVEVVVEVVAHQEAEDQQLKVLQVVEQDMAVMEETEVMPIQVVPQAVVAVEPEVPVPHHLHLIIEEVLEVLDWHIQFPEHLYFMLEAVAVAEIQALQDQVPPQPEEVVLVVMEE